MIIEAMKQALDALEFAKAHGEFEQGSGVLHEINNSSTTLRQAIEQAEKHEVSQEPDEDVTEIVFEAWWMRSGQFIRSGGGEYEKTFAYHAWIAALSVPVQQEPVAWVCYGVNDTHDIDFDENEVNNLPIGTMLYTHHQSVSR